MISKRIGVLGGGQLGKMMGIAAQPWNLDFWILDKDISFPAGHSCTTFIQGDFTNYDDVIRFGSQVDIITIEIEGVNLEALFKLEQMGKKVYPSPSALQIIKDKGTQKVFYLENGFDSSDFKIYDKWQKILQDIESGNLKFPFVQKARTGGYDGRGVAVIKDESDLNRLLLKVPSLIEDLINIEKELAVVAARNPSGEICTFQPVEMVFDPKANLVDHLFSPANINPDLSNKCQNVATQLIKAFDVVGLLAVEFFETKDGALLVNEVAPRTHNSGHHTIEGALTSQFQQHLRAILDLPLGSTAITQNAIMVNILGADGHTGVPHYQGMEEVLKIPGVYIHLYGKKLTKPARKMGHVTIINESLSEAQKYKDFIAETLKVITVN